MLKLLRRASSNSIEVAADLVRREPVRVWLGVTAGVAVLSGLDVGARAYLPHCVSVRWQWSLEVIACIGAFLPLSVSSLLATTLELLFRVLLGCVALLGSLELLHRHLAIDDEDQLGEHHLPAHLANSIEYLRTNSTMFLFAVPAVAICWYFAMFPPSALALIYNMYKGGCHLGAGFFLCSSVLEPDGWRYMPLCAMCLYLSGGRGCGAILCLDGLAALAYSFQYCQRLYFLHEVKRDFYLRVRRTMRMGSLHPTFLQESFEHLIHTTLMSPRARRIAFALHRALSLGSQQQLLWQKYEKLRRSLQASARGLPKIDHVLEIDRERLLASTFRAIEEAPMLSLITSSVSVRFAGEMGQDEGGLLRDWLDSVGQALTQAAIDVDGLTDSSDLSSSWDGSMSGLFVFGKTQAKGCMNRHVFGQQSDDTQKAPLLHVNPANNTLVLRSGTERWNEFFALGRLLALAVRQGAPLPVHFSLTAWKMLLGRPIEASDVAAIDPVFFKHRIEAVLKPNGVELVGEILGEPLVFVSAASPLCPSPLELVAGGAQRLVTEDNKLEYVQRLCTFYICGQVEREWQLLVQGFEDLLPRELLRQHDVDERDLALLIAGLPDVDVSDWQQHSNIEGPLVGTAEGDLLSAWFWEVMEEFGAERRARLLQFTTGSSRLPVGGFSALHPKFCLYLSKGCAERLPTAHTCVNQLNLSAYPSRRVLIAHLQTVCHDASVGFGFH